MISNRHHKMISGLQQSKFELKSCRYLITQNVWSNFIINSTSLSLSLDPTLSCYRHPSTAEIVATGLLALHCCEVFIMVMQTQFWVLGLGFWVMLPRCFFLDLSSPNQKAICSLEDLSFLDFHFISLNLATIGKNWKSILSLIKLAPRWR